MTPLWSVDTKGALVSLRITGPGTNLTLDMSLVYAEALRDELDARIARATATAFLELAARGGLPGV